MVEIFLKGGVMMYPILICSVLGLALLIQKYIQYRRALSILQRPPEELLNDRPLILLPLFECIEKGCNDQELSIVGTKQVREIEKGLSYLGLIAMITPLMGLTGTVLGMIKAFMVISVNPTVNPAMLAGGIWEALITTAAGLIVAIPIHVGHHYLEKRADEIAFLMREVTIFAVNKRP
ncbi:MAG: MotA/TolQ/ExbB proton channel family protein [Nitrospirae bacterium]|nr:MotA/TolQ/ExbB proton channel family protein [Nitrospirota bacterium]